MTLRSIWVVVVLIAFWALLLREISNLGSGQDRNVAGRFTANP